MHADFNGKPNLQLAMDAEGGDNNEAITEFFGLLLQDAYSRELLCDRYYFLSDAVLQKSRMFQGFSPFVEVPGCRLQQAYLIWRQCPRNIRDALMIANGFTPLGDVITLPGITLDPAV